MAKSMNLSKLEFAGVAAVKFAKYSDIRDSQPDFIAKKRVREPDLCPFYLN
jgi:hypothetical protein